MTFDIGLHVVHGLSVVGRSVTSQLEFLDRLPNFLSNGAPLAQALSARGVPAATKTIR